MHYLLSSKGTLPLLLHTVVDLPGFAAGMFVMFLIVLLGWLLLE